MTPFDTRKLVGQWRLCDYRDSIVHLSYADLSDCSRKETIVFTDSLMKRMTYSYFKNKCHKEAEVSPYTIERRKFKFTTIETRHHNEALHLAIVNLNDTLLKLKIVYSAYAEGQYMSYKKVSP